MPRGMENLQRWLQHPDVRDWARVAMADPPPSFGSDLRRQIEEKGEAEEEEFVRLQTASHDDDDGSLPLEEMDRLSMEVAKKLALLSPMRLLPIELMSHIFREANIASFPASTIPLFNYMLVCRRWNDIVISVPSLWSSIVVPSKWKSQRDDDTAAREADAMQSWLSRARSTTLSVHYIESPMAEHIAQILTPRLGHVRTLSANLQLLSHEHRLSIMAGLEGEVLDAGEFMMEMEPVVDVDELECREDLIFASQTFQFPNVRTLSFISTGTIPEFCSPLLHRLSLSHVGISYRQLAFISGECPNLSQIDEDSCIDASDKSLLNIRLPHLIFPSLSCITIANALALTPSGFTHIYHILNGAPSLEYLIVSVQRVDFFPPLEPSHQMHHLTNLELRINRRVGGVFREAPIHSWLATLPHLESLAIDLIESPGHINFRIDVHKLIKLLRIIDHEPIICPRLCILSLKKCIVEREMLLWTLMKRFNDKEDPLEEEVKDHEEDEEDESPFVTLRVNTEDCPGIPDVEDADYWDLKRATNHMIQEEKRQKESEAGYNLDE